VLGQEPEYAERLALLLSTQTSNPKERSVRHHSTPAVRVLARVTATAMTAIALVLLVASPASANVTTSRAELAGSRLRIEGTATPNRAITVDGATLGASDATGAFRVEKTPFATPANCTVQVNDGSVTAATVTLAGCRVTSPPPSTTPPPGMQTGSVGVTGNGGHGVVTSQPAGINCTFAASGITGPCQAFFQAGIVVRLTVRPAADSQFVGFRGTPGCAKAPDITVFANTSITCEVGLQPKF
jgi:hypothetical protein